MKKLFGQTKRPVQPWNYDENDYEWEDAEEAGDAGYADRDEIEGAPCMDTYAEDDIAYGGDGGAVDGGAYFGAEEDIEEEAVFGIAGNDGNGGYGDGETIYGGEESGEAYEMEESETYEPGDDIEEPEGYGASYDGMEEPEKYGVSYDGMEEPEEYGVLYDGMEEPEEYEGEYDGGEEPEEYGAVYDAVEESEEYEGEYDAGEEQDTYRGVEDIDDAEEEYQDEYDADVEQEDCEDEDGVISGMAAYEEDNENHYARKQCQRTDNIDGEAVQYGEELYVHGREDGNESGIEEEYGPEDSVYYNLTGYKEDLNEYAAEDEGDIGEAEYAENGEEDVAYVAQTSVYAEDFEDGEEDTSYAEAESVYAEDYEDGEEDTSYAEAESVYAEDFEDGEEDTSYVQAESVYAEDFEEGEEDTSYAEAESVYADEFEESEEEALYAAETSVYADGLEYAGDNDEYVGEPNRYTQVSEYAESYNGYDSGSGEYAESYDGYAVDGGEYADPYDEYAGDGGEYADMEEYAVEDTDRYDADEYGDNEYGGYGGGEDYPGDGVNAGKKSIPARIGEAFRNMDTMDRIMAIVGAGVLILAVVTGGVFVSSFAMRSQIASFAEVGTQLEGITMIGEKGLMAVADAEVARIMAAAAPEEDVEDTVQEPEPPKEYDEKEYGRQVEVNPDFTSIQKDLKIKFINKKTDKLVANVPFSVMVTGPDGKTFIWSDDDMDGIIYKKDIAAGSYQVVMEALDENKYSDYIISADVRSVQVKEEIVYEKVDVTNEVKQETEIDVSVEDTKVNEVVVESTLQDTVTWVESKILDVTYSEVEKSTIADPATLVLGKAFLRMSANSAHSPSTSPELTDPSGESPSSEPTDPSGENPSSGPTDPSGESPSSGPTDPSGESPSSEPTDSSGEASSSESPDPSGESPSSEPTDPSGEASSPESPDPSGESPSSEPTGPSGEVSSPEPTDPSGESPSPDPVIGKVAVDNAELTGAVGAEMKTKATASGFAEGGELSYRIGSDNTAVATATIDSDGNVSITGVAPGTAVLTITVECRYKPEGAVDVEMTQATASVRVTIADKLALTLDKTSATAYTDEQIVINAALVNALAAEPVLAVESSDTKIATVKAEKNIVTVTGVAAGSAVITVKYTEDGQEAKATCAVTVKGHPRNDKTTKLTDVGGSQLYVLENNTYREAVYADYYTADKFYIKGEVKYSGWQTIDGRVYYFTADGVKVTGEQIIQGAKYNFAADGSLSMGDGSIGIDVSKWNGTIDWNAVKNSGVSYVIIRCGYRGSSEGKLIEDSKFESNIKGATAAGLKVGVYFFSQAVDEVEAVEEASMVLALIKNYTISYPVFLDVETSGGRGDKIDRATRTAVCKAFCQTIQNANYTAGVYSNKTWLETKLNAGELGAYKIWLAQYAASPTYTGKYDIWQYRSTGSLSGISGDVDMNISYLGY